MVSIQKKGLCSLAILCAVLALGACSPDPDSLMPTDTVVIQNIPAVIASTATAASIVLYPGIQSENNLFKVYVQLSKGMDANAGSVAEGSYLVTPADITNGKATVSIPLYVYGTDTPYSGTNWANIAVVISPQNVNYIFDIDCKVTMSQPSSSSSTVSFNWDKLLSKKLMAPYDFCSLYGNDEYPGVIRGDKAPGGDLSGTMNDPPQLPNLTGNTISDAALKAAWWETYFK